MATCIAGVSTWCSTACCGSAANRPRMVSVAANAAPTKLCTSIPQQVLGAAAMPAVRQPVRSRHVYLAVRAQASSSSSGPHSSNPQNLGGGGSAGSPYSAGVRNPYTSGGSPSSPGSAGLSSGGASGGSHGGFGGSGGSGGSAGGPDGPSGFFSKNWLPLMIGAGLLGWPLYSWYRRTYDNKSASQQGGVLDSAKEAGQSAKSSAYHGYEAVKEGAENAAYKVADTASHAAHKVADPVVEAAQWVTGTGHRGTRDTLAQKGQEAYEVAEDKWQDTKHEASRRAGQVAERGQEAAGAAKHKGQEVAEDLAEQGKEKGSGFWETLRGGIAGGTDKAARQAHDAAEQGRYNIKKAVSGVKSPREIEEEENRNKLIYSVGAVVVGLAVVGGAYYWDSKKGDGKGGKAQGGNNTPQNFA